MPEWTIQKIRRFSSPGYNHKSFKGKYFIISHVETWDTFALDYKTVLCQVNSLLNNKGELIASFGENIPLCCRNVGASIFDFTDSFGADYGDVNALIFPDDFVKKYGLRKDNFIDLVIIGVLKDQNKLDDLSEEIYPSRFLTGEIDMQPSGSRAEILPRVTEPLVQQSIKDKFFTDLIQELNRAYSYQLYRATLVTLRTLFENLIIELLRTKFGNSREDLYFYKGKGRGKYLEFSRLLDNLKDVSNEFTQYTTGFNDTFFSFLDKFRESANVGAHALEVYLDRENLEKEKSKLNFYIQLIANVITKIRNSQF